MTKEEQAYAATLNLADRRSYERACAAEVKEPLRLKEVAAPRRRWGWDEEQTANLEQILSEPYSMGFSSPAANLHFHRTTNIRYAED